MYKFIFIFSFVLIFKNFLKIAIYTKNQYIALANMLHSLMKYVIVRNTACPEAVLLSHVSLRRVYG